MTSQEEQLLKGLADRVNRTQVQDKDAEAEQFIQQNIGGNPDALYILAQTTLVQEYALSQAQRQIAEFRAQLQQAQQNQQQPKHSGSFLGNLLHRDEPQRSAPPPPPPQAPRSPVGPPPSDPASGVGPGLAYPAGGYPIPGATVGYGGAPQGGGFLRGALQTATGVAAGALAFEGVETLLHGFGGHSGFGGGFGGPGYANERPEVINNYYADAAGGHDRSNMTDAGREWADSQGPQHTPMEADHNTGLNEGSYLGGGQADRDELAATGDREQDALGVGDDNVDYAANTDDSMTSDDVGQNFAGDDDGGVSDDDAGLGSDDDGGGDFGGGDDFSSGDDGGGF
jgi:hypothetical protein